MSQGRLPAGGTVVGGGLVGADMVHRWLAWPLQDQRMISVPLAVPAPLASTHNPDCTPVTVPSALTFHCWLVWPLQSQMMTLVPLAVPYPLASRHLPPSTVSCLPLTVQSWPSRPLQSNSCVWVPLPELGASRQ